jgi:site-specific DNA-methyltransferase (adenine-specific)
MHKEKFLSRNTEQMMRKRNARKPFFDSLGLRIYNEDFLRTRSIEEGSIDLTVTSPPYSIDMKYGNYDDSIPYSEYLSFSEKWLGKCHKLTATDGRLCLNIPLDKNKGGQQSVYADIVSIAKKVGWKYHTTIIWNEQNISRRTAWGSWLSASAPFVISPVEVIVVLYKSTWKKTSGSQKSDLSREDFMQWTNGFWEFESQDESEITNPVWRFSGESRKRIGHPAPFPIELPRRCIKMFSFVGDSVLDPFMGSGTTLIASHQTNRKGIGVEIDRKYCELALQRIEDGLITGSHQMKIESA